MDAAIKAIEKIVNSKAKVIGYEVKSIRGTTEAQGNVSITIEYNGYSITGRSAHTDIVTASAKAYVNALNKLYVHNKNTANKTTCEIEIDA